MPTISATGIERSFATSHATLALALFVGPGLVAMLVEPLVFLYADRYPRRWFIRGGITAMAVAAFASALAPSVIVLASATALSFVATGACVSLAQATLVDGAGDARSRVMARWTLLSSAGDLVGPLLLGAVAALGLGWRAGYVAMGFVLAAAAVVVWFAKLPGGVGTDDEEDGESPGVLAALRDALRDRVLVAWLFGVALCDLLDEILVVFATIHVRDHLGAGATVLSALVGAMVVGGMIGLVVVERLLLHRRDTTLLIGFATATALAFVAWIAAPTAWLSVALMFPVGFCAAPLYPLAAAQAFARRPSQSGTVLAAGHLFTPLGLGLPWLVGVVADRAGTYVALLVLIVQPLALIVLALVQRPRSEDAERRDAG